MVRYNSIRDIEARARQIIPEYVDLLKLLEDVHPCGQSYDLEGDSLLISYKIRLNLLNFFGKFSLYKRVRIVGLPISLCDKGYYGQIDDIKKIIKNKKGLTIVLNGDRDLESKSLTLSSFIFHNTYDSFNDYLDSLRSPYRRRIIKALDKRDRLEIRRINKYDFNENHYSLYKDVVGRSENPLEVLPLEFFKSYDGEIYEIIAKDTGRLLAFFQLKEFGHSLYFLFCGFRKEDNEPYQLYYNMLINIIEIAIDKGLGSINFGQTSEESKLKIGCLEEKKYLAIYHRNPILNRLLQVFLPMFSYKPYPVNHNVFKKD